MDKINKTVIDGNPVKDFQLSTIENPINPLTIKFADIANDKNLLAYNTLQKYIEAGIDQLTIDNIPAGSWESVTSVTVGLVNGKTREHVSLKTAGVYITRVNKILKNQNPSDSGSYRQGRMFSDFILLYHSDTAVKLHHIESGKTTVIYSTGKIESDDYMLFNEAIYNILNPPPGGTFTRFNAGIQSDDGKIELCKQPQLVIKYLDYTIAMPNNKPESIHDARGRLMLELMSNRIGFTSADILALEPILDGVDTWLTSDYIDRWYSARKSR